MGNAQVIPLLERIARAKASKGGNIIRDGRYTLGILKMVIERLYSGNMFITEFLVLSADNMPGVLDDKGLPMTANAVGTTCSYVLNLDKNESANGNVKSLVMALLGETNEDNVNEQDFVETLTKLLDTDQPARGMIIKAETFRKTIKKGANAGKPFTALRWEYVEESEAQIAARRAEFDKKPPAAA
jgi:hypothetical protein